MLVIERGNRDAEAAMGAVDADEDARTRKAVDIIVGALKGDPPPPILRPSTPRIRPPCTDRAASGGGLR